jgi:ATP-dependent Zn protease
MTADTERELTALHEAGHVVVAYALVCVSGLVTVNAGTAADGG